MAKLITYVMITVGLMALMTLAGVPTNSSWFLDKLGLEIGTVHNFSNTGFYVTIITIGIAALVAVSGIKIGFISAPTETTFVAAAAAVPLAFLVGDLIGIIQAAGTDNWVGYIIFLIMLPFMVGYAITLFDWVRGDFS